MFNRHSIPQLVDLLMARGSHLYHSCQYQDFSSYLVVGGIPSRASLEKNQLDMTGFTTDKKDQTNKVWDKVFLNLEDFGKIFSSGKAGVPNVYGPILFRFKPTLLLKAIDVAICLRSAGAKGFNREFESLKNTHEVDKLYYYPISHSYGIAALKFKAALQKEFGPKAQSIEISCTYQDGIAPFEDLVDVVVDPYSIDGIDLANIVQTKALELGYKFPIRKRKPSINPNFYQIFVELIDEKYPSPNDLASKSSSQFMKEWACQIEIKGGLLLKNYYRFLEYLHNGTIGPIRNNGIEQTQNQIYMSQEIGLAEHFSNEDILDDWYADLFDDEHEDIMEELDEYKVNLARSSEDGWYYSDDEDDEIEYY